MAEWQSPAVSLKRLGEIIARDETDGGRFLQMANASSLALARPVESAEEAVTTLGVEPAASLLLLAHVCAQFDRISPYSFSVDELCRHALATGRLARAIARAERASEELTDHAFTAGLLHDIGKLVLAANAPERYARVQSQSRIGLQTCWEAERESFGLTHAEVGAWLAGVWGLPGPVVEAICFHHQPERSPAKAFSALDSVHAADAIEHELRDDLPPSSLPKLELSCLLRKGLAERRHAWVDLAHSLLISAHLEEAQERTLAA